MMNKQGHCLALLLHCYKVFIMKSVKASKTLIYCTAICTFNVIKYQILLLKHLRLPHISILIALQIFKYP